MWQSAELPNYREKIKKLKKIKKSVDLCDMLCYTNTCREGETKKSHRNAICGSVGTGRRARLRIL